MKFALAFLPLFFIFQAPSVFSQAPSPTPRRDEVVIISTNLIQIDATVTDKDGQVVPDLKASDFEIYENDKPRNITNFTFVATAAPGAAQPVERRKVRSELPEPVHSTPIRPEGVRRTIALVVDDLGLSFSSIHFTQSALKKFVDEQMSPGDLVAIVRTGGGIGVLQQFTTDKRVLYAAIEKIRYNSQSRTGVWSFAPITPTAKEDFNSTMNAVASGEVDLNNMTLGTQEDAAAERGFADFRADGFTVGTLGAVSYVIRGMRNLPGRKAVTLVSEGFSLFEADGGINTRIEGALRNLTELANRSSVVIYTIDPRGLSVPGATAADTFAGLRGDPLAVENKLRERDRAFENSQHSLWNLARETGGDAFLNQNDINKGIQKVLEKQGSYYLIGYQPDEETFDAEKRRFNKLTIRVRRPGLKVQYRSGFFGENEEKVRASLKSPLMQMAEALNSPFGRNDLNLKANALFVIGSKGPSVHSYVHIRAGDIPFKVEKDNFYRANLNVLVLLFDDNGQIVDSIDRVETLKLGERAYKEIRDKGLVYSVQVPVKKIGAYQMRMVIQDQASQKIGTATQFVQLPNLKKRRLTISGMVLYNDRPREDPQNIVQTDERRDIALRQFRAGSNLRFGLAVYNASIESGTPQLTCQLRLFENGREIFRGDENLIPAANQIDPKNINMSGRFTLPADLGPGDYILQVIVRDKLRGPKEIAAQTVDFEVLK